jgi:hypothetical protein
MKHRPHRGAGRRSTWAAAVLALACLAPTTTGCATTVMEGRAASMMYNPDRVGGLPVSDGPTESAPTRPRRRATSKAATVAARTGLRYWQSTIFRASGRRRTLNLFRVTTHRSRR